MKLYAIRWKGEEIKEGDWFKSLGCAISAITHFDGRVVEWVAESSPYNGELRVYSAHALHTGKTGMQLKLWWAEQANLAAAKLDEELEEEFAQMWAPTASALTEGGAA